MKKLFTAFIPVLAFLLIVKSPTMAQAVQIETDNTRTAADRDTNEDHGKWGLVGLVGLLGLMGLRKNGRTDDRIVTTDSPINRS